MHVIYEMRRVNFGNKSRTNIQVLFMDNLYCCCIMRCRWTKPHAGWLGLLHRAGVIKLCPLLGIASHLSKNVYKFSIMHITLY